MKITLVSCIRYGWSMSIAFVFAFSMLCGLCPLILSLINTGGQNFELHLPSYIPRSISGNRKANWTIRWEPEFGRRRHHQARCAAGIDRHDSQQIRQTGHPRQQCWRWVYWGGKNRIWNLHRMLSQEHRIEFDKVDCVWKILLKNCANFLLNFQSTGL